jgi:hypothetical protein
MGEISSLIAVRHAQSLRLISLEIRDWALWYIIEYEAV